MVNINYLHEGLKIYANKDLMRAFLIERHFCIKCLKVAWERIFLASLAPVEIKVLDVTVKVPFSVLT